MKTIASIFLLFIALSVSAQESLKPLNSNPVIKQFLQKNNPFGGCSAAKPYLTAEVSSFIYPDCLESNGSLTISLNTNIEGGTYDWYLNDTFIENTTATSYTFENLEAGVYHIDVIGEDGIEANLFEGLSNGELSGVNEGAFETTIAFCGNGSIEKGPVFTPEPVVYNIFDDADNELATFEFAGDIVDVPAGDYYAFYFNRNTFCAYYVPITVPIEIPAPFPFIDDFSTTEIYPDALKWKDQHAYINRTMAIDPVSLGVATLDGLDGTGNPHLEEPSSVNMVGPADSLTSARFCFADKLPADSLYFSFYYQAMGYGDFPNGPDSLFIDFLDVNGNWINQWATGFDENTPTDRFDPVNFPVTNTDFFFDGFQFRFRNTATINGFNDHWHIDFIVFDAYPLGFNPIIDDICFVYPAPSLLKNYTAMPWFQYDGFQEQENTDNNPQLVRNNRSQSNAIANFVEVIDICNDEIIDPISQKGINNYDPFSKQITNINPSNILPNLVNGNVVIQANYSIQDAGDQLEENNFLSHRQVFSNYMAYDDGSAEKAYGLFGAGGKLAQKYYINQADQLQGVMIYFTHVVEDASNKLFSIKAWSSINELNTPSQSDVVIGEREGFTPQYDSEINYYTVYAFEEPIAVQDSFYIGFEQKFAGEMNIGFDLYTPQTINGDTYNFNFDSSDKLFFDVNANWEQSIFPGTVMIRPILGSEPVASTNIENLQQLNISVTPNPVQNSFEILGLNQQANISLYNVSGQLLVAQNYQNGQQIDINHLAGGIYLLDVETANGRASLKLVKR